MEHWSIFLSYDVEDLRMVPKDKKIDERCVGFSEKLYYMIGIDVY